MKTITSKRSKPGIKLATPQRGCSFQPLPVSGVDVRDDGGNTCQGFDTITAMIERNFQHQTFSVIEALTLSRGLDLDVQEVERLWNKWLREKLKTGEVIAVNGCYNAPVYRFR
jgi:hypothetical protein